MEYISYDDFKKMDIRVGTIRQVELIEGADKLLKCMIDFGEMEPVAETPDVVSPATPKLRQIVSGIRPYFPEHEKLVGKQALYIVNLEPRTIRGVESAGMLLAVGDAENFSLLVPETPVSPGSPVR